MMRINWAERWVSRAVSTDINEPREFMKYVYSNGSKLMATDGHRVHVIEQERQKGFYCPLTFEKQNLPDLKYPDIEKFFKPDVGLDNYDYRNMEHDLLQPIGKWVVRIDDIAFDSRYVREASIYDDVYMATTGKRSVAIGKNQYGRFAIMPIKED